MPFSSLLVTDQSSKDLLTISEQAEGRLEEACARLSTFNDNVISPVTLREQITQVLSPGVARSLIRQLLGLRLFIDSEKISPAEAIEALSVGLKQKGWSDDAYNKWERIALTFAKLVALENIGTTAKALDLSLDFEHRLDDVNILTDIRPVYSVNRDKIVGGIICSRLRLRYDDEDGSKSISISMDKDDIDKLKDACVDALNKIKLASDMVKTSKLPSFVIGDALDDYI
jgi:hypothetical protein